MGRENSRRPTTPTLWNLSAVKRCSCCKKEKALEEFSFKSKATGERHSACKECLRVRFSVIRKVRKQNGKAHAYYLARRDRLRAQQLERQFGISIEQYETMLAAQGGACAICGKPEAAMARGRNGVKRLSVDHDHVSGAVRGILCQRCNTGIGAFEDRLDLLAKAITYLQSHSLATAVS